MSLLDLIIVIGWFWILFWLVVLGVGCALAVLVGDE